MARAQRWAAHLQNDVKARMQWCVKDYAHANHPPEPRIRGTPIVLPGSFAGSKSAQDAAAQTKQIQDLIDLLKRNHPD